MSVEFKAVLLKIYKLKESIVKKNNSVNVSDASTEQNRKDFEALVFPLMNQLYTTALTLTRDSSEAEDLVQDTYLKAYRFFHLFTLGTNFRAWMFRILTNNFINDYRTKKKQPTRVDFESTTITLADEHPEETYNDKSTKLNADYHDFFDDSITTALDKLPEHFRIVLLLSDVSDLKYQEIAEYLSCPIGTVMSRLSRSRKLMAAQLKQYAGSYGYAVN